MINKANSHAHSDAQDPFYWLMKARELDQAASLIWKAMREDWQLLSSAPVGAAIGHEHAPSAGLSGVFWLNAGLALENLLKGILIESDPTLIIGGAITSRLKTHSLLRLAKNAAVSLDVNDAFFLSIGTKCVQWAGRYPRSTKPNSSAALVFSETHVTAYRRLFERFSERFPSSGAKTVSHVRLA